MTLTVQPLNTVEISINLHRLWIGLLLILSMLFSYNSHAGQTSSNPSDQGSVGTTFYFKYVSDTSILTGKKVTIKLTAPNGSSLYKEMARGADNKTFSYNYTFNSYSTGTWKYEIATPSGTEPVKSFIIYPDISSVSSDPSSGLKGSNFTFTANLNGNLPSRWTVKFDFGTGSLFSGTQSGTTFSYTRAMTEVVNSKPFYVRLYDANNNPVITTTKIGYYSVTAPPTLTENVAPTLTFIGKTSPAIKDFFFDLQLKPYDKENKLDKIEVNWGDGSTTPGYTLVNNEIKTISHKYATAGQFVVKAAVSDQEGKAGAIAPINLTVFEAPEAPKLNLPTAGADVPLENVEFNWKEPANNATAQTTGYRIVISQDIGFTGFSEVNKACTADTCLTASTGTATSYRAGKFTKAGHTYYWKVRANGPGGASPWSETRSFTTATYQSNVKPERPVLLAPGNGASNVATSNVQFSWNPPSNDASVHTSGYRIVFSRYSNFDGFVDNQGNSYCEADKGCYTTTTSVNSHIAAELSPGTTYYWKVRATTPYNGSSDWSTPSSFTTKASTTPTVTDVIPTTAIVNVATTFTIKGSNLPSTLQAKIDNTPCTTLSGASASNVQVKCTATSSGFKPFPILTQINGSPIAGSESRYVTVNPANTGLQSAVKDLLSTDAVISHLGLLNYPNDANFSRAEAAVLLDRLLIFTDAAFDKDMSEYLNSYGDVNPGSDYFPSLMHLAYYRGSNTKTAVTRANNLFRPLDHVTRQEFLAMAMEGFNISVQDYGNLNDFKDTTDIASWAYNYFSTAVKLGLVAGNQGSLYPAADITLYEALTILDRIYEHPELLNLHGSGYDLPEDINLQTMLSNTIGTEYEPEYYEMVATPIDITAITVETRTTQCASKPAVVLTAVSTVDNIAGKTKPYYWWSVSDGYLGQYGNDTSFKKVCFYPATKIPASGEYRVTVNGGDNLGFVDTEQALYMAQSLFGTVSYRDIPATMKLQAQNPTQIIAGKLLMLDLTGTTVKKQDLEVGLENLEVMLSIGDTKLPLFKGPPDGFQIPIFVPTLEEYYGQSAAIQITGFTQGTVATKTLSNVKYLPQYIARGRVVNSSDIAAPATAVRIGNQEIALDDSNEFYVELPGDLNNQTLNIKVVGGDATNGFENYPLTLTYQSPRDYVLLVGQAIDQTTPPEPGLVSATGGHEYAALKTPNGGESWAAGTTKTIAWNNQYIAGNQVDLYVLHDDPAGLENTHTPTAGSIVNQKNWYKFASGVANSGSYTLDPGVMNGNGNAYRVLLVSTADNASWDISDANFSINGASLIDSDGDGMPDSWEIAHRLNPYSNDANADKDGDGVTNLQEYQDNTNPTDKNSYSADRFPDRPKVVPGVWISDVTTLFGLDLHELFSFEDQGAYQYYDERYTLNGAKTNRNTFKRNNGTWENSEPEYDLVLTPYGWNRAAGGAPELAKANTDKTMLLADKIDGFGNKVRSYQVRFKALNLANLKIVDSLPDTGWKQLISASATYPTDGTAQIYDVEATAMTGYYRLSCDNLALCPLITVDNGDGTSQQLGQLDELFTLDNSTTNKVIGFRGDETSWYGVQLHGSYGATAGKATVYRTPYSAQTDNSHIISTAALWVRKTVMGAQLIELTLPEALREDGENLIFAYISLRNGIAIGSYSPAGRVDTRRWFNDGALNAIFESAIWPTPSGGTGALNDTGMLSCSDGFIAGVSFCNGSQPAGQDGSYGRDAASNAGQLNKTGGGHAGFDFTKISNSGNELSGSAALGTADNDWACTRDNVTGLLWEVKINDVTKPRHYQHLYQPGNQGTTDTCSNSLGSNNCNTENYVAAVRASHLCGYNDWRMPTAKELESLVDLGLTPHIDSTYFPNIDNYFFWSSVPFAGTGEFAWYMNYSEPSPNYGRPIHPGLILLVR